MIILDMNNKPNPVHVKSNHFIAENNILTLEVKLVSGSSDYDLTGKAITAIFQDKPMTQTLNVIDGLIQVPITNDLLNVGLNQLQLVINYDGAQELSPIMIMVILTSLIPAGPDEPSLNILSALINQINDVHNEEDIRIENEDIRIATQEEWTLIELQRQSAESTRNGNEITRLDSESDRATNEQARVSKESERVTSETARGTAETGRVTAEGSRVTAESSRVSAETNRATFYDGFNAQLGEKAPISTTYTKTEVDNKDALNATKLEIGLLTGLLTTAKTSIVNAINELFNSKANRTQEAWITPTLINGWLEFDAGEYSKIRYFKDTLGFVHLHGLLKTGVKNTIAFRLPVGYRPRTNDVIYFTTRNSGVVIISGYVTSDGNIIPTVLDYTGYIIMTGLSFFAEV